MQNSSQPKLLPVPFADSGSKQDIPNDSQVGITAGRASYTDGFPPLTRTPLAAGGVPPFGTDFNGVLNDITAAVRWGQAGAGYVFNSDFSAAVAGYPKGARIPNSTLDGFWLNTTDGNSANPENTTSALTGWVPSGFYGITAITGLSGSSITLTTLQAGRERITLAGTLTSNINLTVPAWIKRWEIVNNCTGSFNVTVKTPSGTGVSVAAGSIAFVQGDGTNINQAASPGSLLNIQVFSASGTWTKTAGAKKARIKCWGGGGGGANTSATAPAAAASGSGGGYAEGFFDISSISTTPVVVGSGGSSVAANTTSNGGNGGISSVGTLISASGGAGGGSTPSGGSGTNGNIINFTGQLGQGAVSTTLGGTGGASYGTYGGLGHSSSAGDDGGFPGGGGAGGSKPSSAYASGKGAMGYVIIEEYA